MTQEGTYYTSVLVLRLNPARTGWCLPPGYRTTPPFAKATAGHRQVPQTITIAESIGYVEKRRGSAAGVRNTRDGGPSRRRSAWGVCGSANWGLDACVSRSRPEPRRLHCLPAIDARGHRRGAPPVVVLGYRVWSRTFGASLVRHRRHTADPGGFAASVR